MVNILTQHPSQRLAQRFQTQLATLLASLLLLFTCTATNATQIDSDLTHPTQLQQCLGLPDSQRLACYDRIVMQTVPAPTSNNTIPANTADASINTVTPFSINSVANANANTTIPHTLDLTSPQEYTTGIDTGTQTSAPSPIERMWGLRADTQFPAFSLLSYYSNYMLFAQHSSRINRQPTSPAPGRQSTTPTDYRHLESKFQLSVRSKLAQNLFRENDSLWFGYTQISQWQVWSANISRPFRSTSYKPEIFYVTPIQYQIFDTSWTLRMATLGFIHESNGQSNPLSRSWNRVYFGLGLDNGDNLSLYAYVWKRIPESGSSDDNPDITTYVGRANVRLNWDINNDNSLAFTLTSNLRNTHGGSVQLDYYFPLSSLWGMNNYLRGYIQIFHGYGETITDYNFRRSTIGIGVAIKEW